MKPKKSQTIDTNEIFIFTNRSSLMQRLQAAVENEYIYFVSGNVRAEKAVKVIEKLVTSYKTEMTPQQRLRAREKGASLVQAFFYVSLNELEKGVDFYLLHRPAVGHTCPTISSEPWHTVTNRFTRINSRGYELLRIPNERTHQSPKKPLKPYRWSWQYTKERVEQFESKIKRSGVRQSEEDYLSLFATLEKTLGFAAARDQAQRLLYELEQNYKRVSSNEPPRAAKSAKIAVARKMSNVGIKLAELKEILK